MKIDWSSVGPKSDMAPKIDWKPDKAVVAQSKDHEGVILWCVPGSYMQEDISNTGRRTDDLGLDDAPEGISIWEGRYDWYPGSWESPNDGGSDLVGTFRPPTEDEWLCIKQGKNPFPDETEE